MEAAFDVGLSALRDMMAIFARPPLVYFVAVGLVGGIAGVARVFVPMRRR
ncbi:hypothetical protein ACTHQ8_22685 [Lysinibacillus odysseyi]|nr:hypothetical protein [Lysinibacillus odysseyi]